MNILCIVTNNKLRLKTLIKNLPTNRNYEIIFVTDPRISAMNTTIKSLYPKANIVTSTTVLHEFYSKNSCSENVEAYALGYKMVLPWYMFNNYKVDKLLLVDDDILVTEKLNNMFNEINNPAAVNNGTLKINNYNTTSDEIKSLSFNVNNIDCNEHIPYVNGGSLLFTKDLNYNDYIAKVIEFFNSDTVTKALAKQKTWLDFYMDEVFFSCLFYKYSKSFNNTYILNKFVNCRFIVYVDGSLKNIYDNINNYAITHFAGMNDNFVYKTLKELNYETN